ncbi:MAG: (2Fe-2S)-binding protein, partial [Planctomycetota bacterium]
MGPDDLVCYCYRVPLRKLVNYARREKPSRASQMSQCLDAGTGCGWCIPILKRIHENADRFDAAA